MKKFSFVLMFTLLVGMLAACGTAENGEEANTGTEDGAEKKTLVMGTSADYPPFEYIDSAKSNEIIGFDIDIANYIAEQLGYEIEIKDMDFSGLIPALSSERVDFVLSGMTPTEERKENVDFSQIYYAAHHMIVSKTDNKIETVDGLKGKKVGVQLGSIQEGKAKELKDEGLNIEIKQLNRIPELIQDLKAGRLDAVIIEDTVAKGFLENNDDIQGIVMPDTNEEGSAIAFPKGSELTEQFDQVVTEMKENGKMDELINKWFGDEAE
ncbi:transporter substrate-binding domain-containing protein [Bacillus taeanensis]|uniref:ABC transporter substrate-binding protein n=1 Tax=Bacillus taeanensis TaxID=273032 RepID=A0A366Y0X0_9BACI|nr:transporter substrate-binding domain-containing protein [Bacillus taeanensis]RBW70659.1 ABC transporter substrate-binding protein [Bacillus taeanensis]